MPKAWRSWEFFSSQNPKAKKVNKPRINQINLQSYCWHDEMIIIQWTCRLTFVFQNVLTTSYWVTAGVTYALTWFFFYFFFNVFKYPFFYIYKLIRIWINNTDKRDNSWFCKVPSRAILNVHVLLPFKEKYFFPWIYSFVNYYRWLAIGVKETQGWCWWQPRQRLCPGIARRCNAKLIRCRRKRLDYYYYSWQ
jgi:hypothetical protein